MSDWKAIVRKMWAWKKLTGIETSLLEELAKELYELKEDGRARALDLLEELAASLVESRE